MLLRRVAAVLLLHKANHRLIAVGSEMVSRLCVPEVKHTLTLDVGLLARHKRLTNAEILVDRLDLVRKVRDETQTIVELDQQRLLV